MTQVRFTRNGQPVLAVDEVADGKNVMVVMPFNNLSSLVNYMNEHGLVEDMITTEMP